MATSHRVLVSVTITRAGRLRAARQHGFTGTSEQVMLAASVHVGAQVAAVLGRRGYHVGALLSPASLGRVPSVTKRGVVAVVLRRLPKIRD